MGIKSLYVRVILVFVGTVIVSLFMAGILAGTLYRNQIKDLMQDNLINDAKKIIQTYQSTPSADLVPFMHNVAGISNSIIQIYQKDGKPILDEQDKPLHVSTDQIKTVLAGGVARNVTGDEPYLPAVGLPFQTKGEHYALFLMLNSNPLEGEFQNAVRTVLLLVLCFGSLLILIAARYIVQPLLRLTDATRQMAKGKFDVEVQTKRQDEIGQLTVSFNEMAKELAKLDRMRADFVTNVSHEIQSPLTSISGFTKALKQKKMTEEDRNHYLNIIEAESDRLSRLSQNLLQLSYLQHDNHKLWTSTFRLDEQVRQGVIALEPLWSAKQITVDLQLPVIHVQADEDQLRQVWTNLLSNSIKFTPAHGTIRINAELTTQATTVSITDTGIGIPQTEQADIFKPFHKVDKSRDGSVTGNGLGLSIVKQIVDLHHGDVQVTGQAGKGCTFTVTLPANQT